MASEPRSVLDRSLALFFCVFRPSALRPEFGNGTGWSESTPLPFIVFDSQLRGGAFPYRPNPGFFS